MTSWIWALSFSVLGPVPESGTFYKYSSQEECQRALTALKQEKKAQNKILVGSCQLVLKDKNK